MDPLKLYVVIFVLIMLGGITLYETIFGGKSDVSGRLFTGPDTIRGFQFGAAHAGRLLRWNIRRLRGTRSRSPGEQKLPAVMTVAGFRGVESVARIQLIRLAIAGGTGLAGTILCIWAGQPFVIGAMAGLLIGYIVPRIVIARMARSRQRRMTRELPDLLALMVVCLEAGVGITEVLRMVGHETERRGHLLGRELSLTSSQMSAGMSFEQTLKDL